MAMAKFKTSMEEKILEKINKHREGMGSRVIFFEKLDHIIKHHHFNTTPLKYALANGERINLNEKEMDCLIENSDLSLIYDVGSGWSALTEAIMCADQKVLTHKQYQKLIDNCPQKNFEKGAYSYLAYALFKINHTQFSFSLENWKSLIKNTGENYFHDHDGELILSIIRMANHQDLKRFNHNVLWKETIQKINFKSENNKLYINIIYGALKNGQFNIALDVAERMNKKTLKKCIIEIKEKYAHLVETKEKNELFNNLDKIQEIIKTKTGIEKNLAKSGAPITRAKI